MALSIPHEGSGVFVPERVWSCPDHDEPQYDDHDCDCEHCSYEPPDGCPTCETATRVDKLDEGGGVVRRELSVWEHAFRQMAERDGMLAATHEYILKPNLSAKIVWLEDELIPSLNPRADKAA